MIVNFSNFERSKELGLKIYRREKIERLLTTVIATVLFATISSSGYGQNVKYKFYPETYIGVKGGVNISNVKFNPTKESYSGITADYESTTGRNFGLVVRHISERHFGILGEVVYSEQGWSEAPRDEVLEYSRRATYMHIPIMTHINFGNGAARFILNLGPGVSFLIGDEETLVFDSEASEARQSELSLPYYGEKIDNTFDFMFVAGGGFELNTDLGAFLLEARYNLSLLSILSEDKYSYNNTYSNNVGITLSWLFLTNKKSNKNPKKYPKKMPPIRSF